MTPDELRARADAADAEVRKAWRELVADLLAVSGHLDQPYPDDPRWTPWTRFVERGIRRMKDAISADPLAPDLARLCAEFGEAAQQTTHGTHHGSVWSPMYGKDVCADLHGECEVCAALAKLAELGAR